MFPNVDVSKRGRFQAWTFPSVDVFKRGRFQAWAFPNVGVLYNASQNEGVLHYTEAKNENALYYGCQNESVLYHGSKKESALYYRSRNESALYYGNENESLLAARRTPIRSRLAPSAATRLGAARIYAWGSPTSITGDKETKRVVIFGGAPSRASSLVRLH